MFSILQGPGIPACVQMFFGHDELHLDRSILDGKYPELKMEHTLVPS